MTITGTREEGGQKIVYPCTINTEPWAIKLMLTDPSSVLPAATAAVSGAIDTVTARARREVSIMAQCDSPHLVRLGPLTLSTIDVAGQNILYFTEEWIDGTALDAIIRDETPLSIETVVRVGKHITEAIKELWSKDQIHRDVKPGNIMRRAVNGDFVLLDMGLAFDVNEPSITAAGLVPGTMIYLSPEQADLANKRQLDFRSDLFSLGIVLYECTTGEHPFWKPGLTSREALAGILTRDPDPPSAARADVPPELDRIVLRLLSKLAHLRYRDCDQLAAALAAIPVAGSI